MTRLDCPACKKGNMFTPGMLEDPRASWICWNCGATSEMHKFRSN